MEESTAVPLENAAEAESPADEFEEFEAEFDQRIVAHHAPRSRIAEQYRTLTENLLKLDHGYPPTSILVTSAGPGEGRSVTTMNLGVSFASRRKLRVLAIDADLRNPNLHWLAGLPGDGGLSGYLAGEISLDEAILPTARRGLDLLPAGWTECNPAEALSSSDFRKLLVTAASDYEHVLIDSPGVGCVGDAAIIGPEVDGVLLAIRSSGTQQQDAAQAKFLLERVDSRILGMVLTHLPMSREEN
jgi:capsular exopolysaccharide synthesis family protein